jgi:hypothetical protein
MRCNPTARWGPGTTKERIADTESSNQLKARLEQMAKERAKQDSMWQPQSSEAQGQDLDLNQKKMPK